MKKMIAMITKITRATLMASVAVTALPGLAWSHPGHGLDGLWVHDMLHGATVVFAVVLATLLTVGFIRHRRQKKRR